MKRSFKILGSESWLSIFHNLPLPKPVNGNKLFNYENKSLQLQEKSLVGNPEIDNIKLNIIYFKNKENKWIV